jgi:hypothetical protein
MTLRLFYANCLKSVLNIDVALYSSACFLSVAVERILVRPKVTHVA